MEFTYRFQDPALATLAFTHRSIGRPNNERLEFLGDALLGAIVGEMLFVAHPKASEGELSRLRAQLVSGVALAALARELKLGDSLQLGPGELKSGGFRRDSIRSTVHGLFEARIAALRRSSKDAKTRLQEWLQADGWPLPVYELTASHGDDHAKTFDITCSISEPLALSVQASASSRRAAEQDAAQNVLAQLHALKHPPSAA